MDEKLYEVRRFYEDGRPSRVLKRHLTRKQVEDWAHDPDTSSMTARKPKGCDGDEAQIQRWHRKEKHWFDGFDEEGK